MKLYGFYRISRNCPAPLNPVFTDGEGNYYTQSINDDRRIAAFLPFVPEKNRIIIPGSSFSEDLEIGSHALFAIEYIAKGVRYGSIRQISEHIAELNASNFFLKHPFALLEFATLLEDRDLTQKAAAACADALYSIDPRLESSWISGSNLPFELRQRRDLQLDEGSSGYVHLSFSATYRALTNLTDFSRDHLSRYRSTIFREAIKEVIKNGLAFVKTDEAQEFLEIFATTARAQLRTEKYDNRLTIYSQESRGNLKLKRRDYDKFLDNISSFAMEDYVHRNAKAEDRENIFLFFFENRSRFIIFVMYMYFFTSFSSFRGFITDKPFFGYE